MFIKRAICTLLAVLLTLAALIILFPAQFRGIAPELDLNTIVDVRDLDITHFPFYGNEGHASAQNYGVSDVIAAYADYVEKGNGNTPNPLTLLKTISERSDFLDTLYTFLIMSLLSIPVYLVLRLLVYNTLYTFVEDGLILARIFGRGLVAVDVSLVTVTATWILQKQYLSLILDFLKDKIAPLTSVEIALNVTNIVILAIVAVSVIAILRATLFRGSVFTSILCAVLRTLVFVIAVAAISIFITRTTRRTIFIMIGAIMVIGLLKNFFVPEAKARRSYR